LDGRKRRNYIYKDIWMEEEAEEEEQEKAGEGSKAIQKEEGDPGGDTEEVKERDILPSHNLM
jgi:hypothetical protein